MTNIKTFSHENNDYDEDNTDARVSTIPGLYLRNYSQAKKSDSTK